MLQPSGECHPAESIIPPVKEFQKVELLHWLKFLVCSVSAERHDVNGTVIIDRKQRR